MLTRKQYLALCLSEEANEVAQRVSKALRFGFDEVQPGQYLNNIQRLWVEIADFFATIDVIVKETGPVQQLDMNELVAAKQIKIEKFYKYAQEQGTVEKIPQYDPNFDPTSTEVEFCQDPDCEICKEADHYERQKPSPESIQD